MGKSWHNINQPHLPYARNLFFIKPTKKRKKKLDFLERNIAHKVGRRVASRCVGLAALRGSRGWLFPTTGVSSGDDDDDSLSGCTVSHQVEKCVERKGEDEHHNDNVFHCDDCFRCYFWILWKSSSLAVRSSSGAVGGWVSNLRITIWVRGAGKWGSRLTFEEASLGG